MAGSIATRWLPDFTASLARAVEGAQSQAFWSQHATKTFDLSIAALLVVAPLVWGGRHEMGRFVFAAVVLVGAVAWGIRWNTSRQSGPLQLSHGLWIPILAALWLVVQVIPMPAVLLDTLLSSTSSRLPMWNGENSLASLPSWPTISLVPSATLASLAVLIGYGLVFFLVLQWLTTLSDIQKLLRWVGLACGFMALFGLLQHFTADGRFFWVYDHPFRDTSHVVCGSFINRNHFAHFVGMGVIASLSQLVLTNLAPQTKTHVPATSSPWQRRGKVWIGVLALSILALLLSFSRGGVAACAVGMLVAVAIAWWYRLWNGRQLLSLALVALVVGGVLACHRGEQLANRLDDLGSGSLEELDRGGARRVIWEANLRAIQTFWLTGSGAGTHREVAPAFLSESRVKPYTHAENGYLQILTETGLVGGLLLIATLGFAAGWTITILRATRNPVVIACTASLVGGLALSACHSLSDFVWYIPATMTLAIMMLAALCRLTTLARDMGETSPATTATSASQAGPAQETRLQWACAVGAIAFGMLVPLVRPALAAGDWDRYLVYSTIQSAQNDAGGWQSLVDAAQPNVAGDIDLLRAKIDSLTAALAYDPHHYLAHVRLAQTYLQLFEARAPLRENQQGLSQIEATVAAAQFTTSQDVRDWLRRAVGGDVALLIHARHHARQAVRLSPFDGTAYVCLAHTSLLDDPTGKLGRDYLQQASQVRPQDGDVLFAYGKSLLMAGQVTQAIEAWQQAFLQPGPQRQMIVQIFGGRVPAEQFLETFAPDWRTLPSVWQQYHTARKPDDLEVLLDYARSQAEQYVRTPGNPASPHIWRALAGMYRDRGDGTGELTCLEAAMKENGSLYPVRHDLAIALARQGKHREAQAHFRWCLAVRPENQAMRRSYQQALEAERSARVFPTNDSQSTLVR